eukprot:scaffold229067_cov33-Tisochrysis_lutea.AAC.6
MDDSVSRVAIALSSPAPHRNEPFRLGVVIGSSRKRLYGEERVMGGTGDGLPREIHAESTGDMDASTLCSWLCAIGADTAPAEYCGCSSSRM